MDQRPWDQATTNSLSQATTSALSQATTSALSRPASLTASPTAFPSNIANGKGDNKGSEIGLGIGLGVALLAALALLFWEHRKRVRAEARLAEQQGEYKSSPERALAHETQYEQPKAELASGEAELP
ncbi:hypothetical protein AOQ84DRAFT_405265 [Glonium stellatum]|uniref:Uncharacterized protein n=1 Tax=Glonium stellatum TaxID=574774 RepID=A0A8E2F2K5_9PEZI|nr:hypothetical protein AOQ84DRAFT_405265 [Glonium stellatum]